MLLFLLLFCCCCCFRFYLAHGLKFCHCCCCCRRYRVFNCFCFVRQLALFWWKVLIFMKHRTREIWKHHIDEYSLVPNERKSTIPYNLQAYQLLPKREQLFRGYRIEKILTEELNLTVTLTFKTSFQTVWHKSHRFGCCERFSRSHGQSHGQGHCNILIL